MHGYGTLFYSNNKWYRGDFKDGKKHGEGKNKEVFEDGTKYIGDY